MIGIQDDRECERVHCSGHRWLLSHNSFPRWGQQILFAGSAKPKSLTFNDVDFAMKDDTCKESKKEFTIPPKLLTTGFFSPLLEYSFPMLCQHLRMLKWNLGHSSAFF